MLIKKSQFSAKSISKKSLQPNSPPNWRNQLEQSQLVSQISSTLLQRRNWAAILRPLSLSSLLSPPIFPRILDKTQSDPQLSLKFFNWAKSNLGFKPDLKTLTSLIRVLIGSGLIHNSKPILDSLIQTYPPIQIAESAIQTCKGTIFHSSVLGSVIEHYCRSDSFLRALEIYKKGIENGIVLSICSCNSLLGNLEAMNETRLAWGLYGNMIRNGILPDKFTWSLLARILCKDGKFETIVRILNMGVYNSLIYNLVIDSYSKKGDFRAAFDYLKEMHDRKVDTDFRTYSSILDGGCKFGDDEVVETVISLMTEKGLLPKLPVTNFDLIIQKISELGGTFAMSMFFDRACDEKIELNVSSYGYMLMAFSKGGRVREGIQIYRKILDRDIIVDDSCYNEFVYTLCDEDPSEEISGLLKEIIRREISPPALSKLSDFVTKQCAKGFWRDAEELMNLMLDKEIVPSSSCCSQLVLHYCNRRDFDYAMRLYSKVQNMNGVLDVKTYNVLIDGIMKERRAEEANKVFDYMRTRNLINGESYSIMIRGLCQENELRQAMKLHDEMLELGHKPDLKAYKRLILCFK